ncbi:arrestin domain-containing protein 3-like [Mizuhopecten yessoensis]|uniref:Arrestin domain-containing protein 3 n=1 Tax=Mizuhopecten yessoensis TaxID=6573 RepID=A0A210QMA2_MIZYE|nr:arrestin domain-containing protein 3-like [Mizuhopecten yessoensis]OWF49831.1 Arrestin domain-containing protein 3 [Mizuhopecten yessoensis]
MVVNVSISLVNNPSAVYYPGQTVQACVQFHSTVQNRVKGIYAKFKGNSHTSWSTGSGDNKQSHSETEQYFKTEIPLFQAPEGDYVEMQPGNYGYPVNFLLPQVVPSSFEGGTGYVRYLIKAKVRIKGGTDYRVQHPFTVIFMLDLNTIPEARLPAQMQDTKTGCCLCCKTGPVTCMIRLDKQGFVPGENIKINAEVTNNGTSSIHMTTVSLNMTTVFKAHGSTTSRSKVLSTISHGAVGPRESDIWSGDQLLVLSTPPSYLYGCSIIDIQYSCRLAADMEGSLMDIKFDLPVIIGTIPLRPLEDLPLQPPTMSYGQPSEPSWLPSNDQQPDNIALNNMGNAGPITTQPGRPPDAPPSYEECMTTNRVRIMRQNSNSADQGEEFSNFAPSYPYYKEKA